MNQPQGEIRRKTDAILELAAGDRHNGTLPPNDAAFLPPLAKTPPRPDLPYFLQLAVMAMRFNRSAWHAHVERTSKKLKMVLPDSQAFLLNPTLRFALTGGVGSGLISPTATTEELKRALFDRIVSYFGEGTVSSMDDVPVVVTRVSCALYSMGALQPRDTPLARLADVSGCMHTQETVLHRKTADSITDAELEGIARALLDEPVDALGIPTRSSQLTDVIDAMRHGKQSSMPRFAVLIRVVDRRLLGIYSKVYSDFSGTLTVAEIPTDVLQLFQHGSIMEAVKAAGNVFPTLVSLAAGPVAQSEDAQRAGGKGDGGDNDADNVAEALRNVTHLRASHLHRAASRLKDGMTKWVLLEQHYQQQRKLKQKAPPPLLMARVARNFVKHVTHVQAFLSLTAMLMADNKRFLEVQKMYTFLAMMQDVLRPKYEIFATAGSKYSDLSIKQFSIANIVLSSSTAPPPSATDAYDSTASTYAFLKQLVASK